ncbi:MAG TPA: insulinase family protein [Gemmatimonadaceae bacterium]|nr:insulinase family protein [Gemmatimonadaceae bacterium]
MSFPRILAARPSRSALFAVLLPVAASGTVLRAQGPDSAAIAALAKNPGAQLPLDPRARVRTLPNGLRYYIRQNARPEKRAELRLVVNIGSIVEDDDQLGLAHMLEHMAFNGTRHFAKTQIVDFIERAGMKFGADLNAGTSFDETVYQLQLPTDTGGYIPRALDWFADIAGGGLTLDSAEMNKERPVVIEEWRLGKGAQERMQQKQFPVLFRNSRYAQRLPIGTKESLDKFTRAQLARLYLDWYRPDLMAVVVVGDIKPDSVEALIKAKFGAIPAAPTTVRSRDLAAVPGHTETLVAIASDAEAQESNVGVIWKQPVVKRTTVGEYAQDVAGGMFLSMLNDRFGEITRKPDAPFVDAGAGQGRLVRATESFSLSAVVEDGGIERGLAAILAEAERVRRFGFTETEFAREKTQIARSLDIQFAERDKTESGTFAARYVDHFLTGDPLLGIEIRAPLTRALLPQITLAQVNAFAQEWMVERNRVILASAPIKPGVKLPTDSALLAVLNNSRAATLTAYVDNSSDASIVANPPTPGKIVAERKLDAIGVTEWTLSNGARVLIKPTDFKADEILVTGVSIGGVGGVPPDRYYSARLGPLLLERGGAGTIDAIALQKMLAGKVAAVSADVDDRTESVGGQTSPRDLDLFFQLMWAKLETPRVDTAAVTAIKQQYVAFVKNRSNEPTAVYGDTIGETMAQYHPLAKPVTEEAIKAFDVNVSLDVFRDRFKDFSDFTFVVVGAVDMAALRPLVEKWVASLPGGGRKEVAHDPGIRPPTGTITKVVKKGVEPKATTTILITGKTPWTREGAMRAAAISAILDIRMRETLREDLGGTYGVGVGVGLDRWPEERFTTSVTFGASPARIDSLSNVALDVLRKFANDGPTSDELSKVRENLLRERETALKENEFWITMLQNQVLWGDDASDSYLTFANRVKALDPGSIKALAKIVLNTANMAKFTLLPEK